MLADAQRVGDDRERGIDRTARDKKAAVDDVKVIEVVCLAVHVEGAGFGVLAKAHGADLMGYTGKLNSLADEQIAGEESFVAVVAVHFAAALLLHELFQLRG